jgi:hypothetical protein
MSKDWIIKTIENKGNDFNKIGTPDCFKPNNDPYPLCIGSKNNIEICKYCCLYENMVESFGE